MRGAACVLLSLTFALGIAQDLSARNCRVNLVPNGRKFNCLTCHTRTTGGSRNLFGQQVEALVPANDCAAPIWGPSLAEFDSDGDHLSNGEELGDLIGSWKVGDPMPGDPAQLTNPGVKDQTPPPPVDALFIRGDVNFDAKLEITDAIVTLEYLFLGSPPLACLKAADVTDDGLLDISDPIALLAFLFSGGSPPQSPYPGAGRDPTPDWLPCEEPSITDVTIGPASLSITGIGSTARVRVTGKKGGAEIDLSAAAAGSSYRVADSRIAAVYRDGLVEARAAGSTDVFAEHRGVLATIRIAVTAGTVELGGRVLAVNDLGMHCMDREFSVFAILPPYNVLQAQVSRWDVTGAPGLVDPAAVKLTYSPLPDARGSVNSSSVSRTDFWAQSEGLFGAPIEPGRGLRGQFMPDDAPEAGPQPLQWSAGRGVFVAEGIPITPIDDAGAENAYPLLRVIARDAETGTVFAYTDVVVPVSQEIGCRDCHATGSVAALDSKITWSTAADLEIQAKQNILRLHDARNQTTLSETTPVLCGRCHYSRALDLDGNGPTPTQSQYPGLSNAMHRFHGNAVDSDGQPVFPADAPEETSCYRCHPGQITQCQRGAMRTGGMTCHDCHGGLLQLAGTVPLLAGGSLDGTNDGRARRPWVDLPRCESCHTGDARTHLAGPDLLFAPDGFRLRQTFRLGDDSASPIAAPGARFAAESGKLFRFSKGHGGLACMSCHGSPHAEWPNADPAHNDNVAAQQIQGHAGVIIECDACHKPGSLPTTQDGPHGMHNVNDMRWVKPRHGQLFERQYRNCQSCHGVDLQGSPLSRTAADRIFRIEDDQIVRIPKGTAVHCHFCHRQPVPGQEF